MNNFNKQSINYQIAIASKCIARDAIISLSRILDSDKMTLPPEVILEYSKVLKNCYDIINDFNDRNTGKVQ